MTEKNSFTEDDKFFSHRAAENASPGELLRQAREASGLDIADVANFLKVPVKKLEALEKNEFAAFSDIVFMRALAASVCRVLGVNSASILALLPDGVQPRLLFDQEGLSTNLEFNKKNHKNFLDKQKYFFLLIILAILLASVLLIIQKKLDIFGTSNKKLYEFSLDINKNTPSKNSLFNTEDLEKKSLTVAEKSLAATQEDELPRDYIFKKTTVDSAVEEEKKISNFIEFKVRDSSWVQVRDLNGSVVLQRTLMAGESVGVSKSTPLSVIVGRADVTDVYVRGVHFDLMSLSKENVARFEVK